MNNTLPICLSLLFSLFAAREFDPQTEAPLRLVQKIPMPDVKGRIDHMDVDAKGEHLFVAGLENGSLEVVDLRAGKWAKSIRGFKKTQGIAYVASLNKLFVASGDDGMLRVFRGDTLEPAGEIKLDLGANRVAYDPRSKILYIGYGGKDAGRDYGEVGLIDATTNQQIGDVKVAAHPAELLLDQTGATLFVFVSTASKVQIVDTKKRQVVDTWPISSQRNGDGAFDETTHRIFVGTHTPPQMIVADSRTGTEIANLPTVEGMDGVNWDATHKRIYVSGGRGNGVGYVFVYAQHSADQYELIGKIPTAAGAGTSIWSGGLNRLFVAAPAHDGQEASILVFEPGP
jgi:WD40 repeat protein